MVDKQMSAGRTQLITSEEDTVERQKTSDEKAMARAPDLDHNRCVQDEVVHNFSLSAHVFKYIRMNALSQVSGGLLPIISAR
jgi:hypothetical protein